MEARVAIIESDVEHLKNDVKDLKQDLKAVRTPQERDFRVLFGALITVALGLAGMMAKGFGWF